MHGLGPAHLLKLHGLTALNSAAGGAAAPPDVQPLTDGAVLRLTTATSLASNDLEIDEEAGIIRGVSIMSVGPATGHGFEIDSRTLDTLVDAFNALDQPPPAHLTHGNWDTDPLEILVGRAHNLRRDGDRVRGDMHVANYANLSPRGRLRDFILGVAAEDPGAIGISVVAAFDFERAYDNRGEVERVVARTKFLKDVDFVGDPASNRNGLLSTPGRQAGPPPPAHHADGATDMNPRLRQFLESKGLKKGATDAEAWAHLRKLTGGARTKAESLMTPGTTLPTPDGDGDGEGAGASGGGPEGNGNGQGAGGTQLANGNGAQGGNPTPSTSRPPVEPAGGDGAVTFTQAQLDARVSSAVDTALQRQAQANQERITPRTNLAQRAHVGQEMLAQWINNGTTIEQATDAALTASLENNGPVTGLSMPNVTGGEDGRAALCTGIEDMILERMGVPLYETDSRGVIQLNAAGERTFRQPHELTPNLHHLSLEGVCRKWLRHLGVPVWEDISAEEAAQLCFNRFALSRYLGGVALAHTTGDFPGIFGNVLNKTLVPAYEEEPSTWETWAQQHDVKDFRQVQFHSVGDIAVPPRVREGQEYELAYITEKYEVGQVFKYGCLTSITWEMMINDDLNAFSESVWGFSMASHALENDLLYDLLISNPAMNEDATALFHADHNNLNYGSGAAALDQDTLNDMRVGMRLQKKLPSRAGLTDGRHLNLRPNVLLVPIELETTAEQLLASMTQLAQANPNVPAFRFLKSLTPVSESRLSDDSTTAHYLVSTRRPHAPARVLKLRGHTAPHIERLETGTSIDGRTWKLRHVAGATFTEWRSIQKNAGA